MTALPIAKLRAFAQTLQRPRCSPVRYWSRVVGVIEAGSGTIAWTPSQPWEGPIAPVTVGEFLRIDARRHHRG